ncbi:class I SAM-dependent methyltransferase [Aliiroseovarius sp. S2029]|uniref:class I SAM-dependent methyltransferase n=1 Tax=Aliiroseovarius sp. S2029 TaxID=2936988 RepID=UPI0020BF155A|nr:class I SAM-dependent methyltransferase [Aliiroseovarius sp. S2029]MCK8483938.1 class I SAM-dependent methyltransferase [Aliiroseovarius sp. S2029]
MKPQSPGQSTDRVALYRDILRSVPGLSGMYDLAAALISQHVPPGGRVLITGAGGGREIEALGARARTLDLVALDPSDENLKLSRLAAEKAGACDRVNFVTGTIDTLPIQPRFDAATSLLVMQQLQDDGAKLDYLTALKARIAPGGLLIHADVSCDGADEFEALRPAYVAHAKSAGVAEHVINLETDAISRLPIITPSRTRALFREAGLAPPREVFRTLWYRCWVSGVDAAT